MYKILNTLMILIIILFTFTIYKYYSSNKNIESKSYIRNNIDEIINKKITNLPILENDTDNIVEFNDGFSNKTKNQKPRSFWNLLKFE